MTAVLDTRIPAGLNADGMTPDEARQYQTLRAHRALGLLMQRVPISIPFWRWSISAGIHTAIDNTLGIEATLGDIPNGHASRAAVMGLSEQFGLDYVEKPHLNGKNIVSATGFYAGVPVKFYDLVEPCACGCGGAR